MSHSLDLSGLIHHLSGVGTFLATFISPSYNRMLGIKFGVVGLHVMSIIFCVLWVIGNIPSLYIVQIILSLSNFLKIS